VTAKTPAQRRAALGGLAAAINLGPEGRSERAAEGQKGLAAKFGNDPVALSAHMKTLALRRHARRASGKGR
jgi:hypothetical protein